MQKTLKSFLGVTLLEIMLVLAIAAMIVVMSIRYYQSATTSQQANAVIETVQAITAAMDNLSQGSGGYGSVSQAQLTGVVGTTNMIVPGGGGGSYSLQGQSATSYSIQITGMTSGVCYTVAARIGPNMGSHFTAPASVSCGNAGPNNSVTYTYNSTL
ncbi:hypothetical protein AYO45_03780 [Gammaproteobacteria bacterium SCGC AG-212-F23]|nr:hypothetical protein AYO45_03780 [Gammaproteobacteria bacterium SCGC AG-212-F23]